MRLWYLICLILFIQSISILIHSRYDVTYHLEYDSKWKKSISYSGCYKLINIFKNETVIKINWLENAIYNYIDHPYDIEVRKLSLKKIRLKDYYINNGWLCLIGYHNLKDYLIVNSNHFEINFVFNNEKLYFLNIKNVKFRND